MNAKRTAVGLHEDLEIPSCRAAGGSDPLRPGSQLTGLAERGFEPSVPGLPVHVISSHADSTTLASLRGTATAVEARGYLSYTTRMGAASDVGSRALPRRLCARRLAFQGMKAYQTPAIWSG
jgi:hypothetical protein